MKIRVLNTQSIRELLTVEQCIPLMRQALRLAAQGRALQPIRVVHATPDAKGTMGIMPGYIEEPRWLGIKVMTVFAGNAGTPVGTHQGIVTLYDPATGVPRAIMDAREITGIRTAAATAVGTEVLARKDARTLAIYGCGHQAHTHAEAVTTVRQFDEILVWGRDFTRCRAFVEGLRKDMVGRKDFPKSIRAVEKPEEASGADVICTTTAAREPFFRAAWLRAGQHLNLVGSSIPATSEVEPQVVARSRFFVDFKESALALAGDFRRAKEAGLVGDDHIVGSVGQVMEGTAPGRTADADITVFKSLGMVAEDLVTADFLLREADRLDVGPAVEW